MVENHPMWTVMLENNGLLQEADVGSMGLALPQQCPSSSEMISVIC
jgi:hypothetical protein